MLNIKKARIEELDRMVLTLMTMKNSEDCITTNEMHDYIDRTYYAEDGNKNIVAIVCANRRSIPYSEEATALDLYSTRYQIKYSLFSKQAIEDAGYDATKVMTRLLKELCADLSDWSVWLDVEFQAGINLGSSAEDTTEILTNAALANSFHKASNRFGYIRVMPINFTTQH